MALTRFDAAALGAELERPDAPPFLIDFWASWCGTCRLLEPAVARVAERRRGALRVGVVDVDADPEVAAGWGVLGLPTLLLVGDGSEVIRITKFQGEEALNAALAPHLQAV